MLQVFMFLIDTTTTAKPQTHEMWRSQERIAQGRKYLPKYTQRMINSYAISYGKFTKEFQAVVEQHNTAKSWQNIVDLTTQTDHPDGKQPHDAEVAKVLSNSKNAQSFYLSQIHPWMLEAMLSGQVALQYHNEEVFEAAISKAHGLGEFPTTYVNIPSRVRHGRIDRRTLEPGNTQTSQRSEWAGFGLSPYQMGIVCRLMLGYINLKTDSASTLAKINAIDEAYPPSRGLKLHEPNVGRPSERLYLPTWRSIEMIGLLAKRIYWQIVQKARADMDDIQFKEPFPWCFSEVGFGIHGEKRTRDYHYHDGTNYLFGLLTAILRVEWPDQFEILGLTVHVVVDPTHANGAEGIASVLNGTYLLPDDKEWIGLNPTLAGGLKIKWYSDPRWELHFRKAKDQIGMVVNYQHQIEKEDKKRQKIVDVRNKYEELESLRQEVEDLQTKRAQACEARQESSAEQPPPLKSVNERIRELLEKRKVEEDQVSSAPFVRIRDSQDEYPMDVVSPSQKRDTLQGGALTPYWQCDNSQDEFSSPPLQRDDSIDELTEDVSDIDSPIPTPNVPRRRANMAYLMSTPPSHEVQSKRLSPFDEILRPPKMARQGSMTSRRVVDPTSPSE